MKYTLTNRIGQSVLESESERHAVWRLGVELQVTALNVGSVIIAAIPELRADVEEWEELDHLQFMELFLWTESSVVSANIDNLYRAVRLVDAIFLDCDSAIKNAVTVSFLERIDPEDEIGKQIFDALTPALRSQWQALDEYMIQLIGKSLRGSVARNAGSTKIAE